MIQEKAELDLSQLESFDICDYQKSLSTDNQQEQNEFQNKNGQNQTTQKVVAPSFFSKTNGFQFSNQCFQKQQQQNNLIGFQDQECFSNRKVIKKMGSQEIASQRRISRIQESLQKESLKKNKNNQIQQDTLNFKIEELGPWEQENMNKPFSNDPTYNLYSLRQSSITKSSMNGNNNKSIDSLEKPKDFSAQPKQKEIIKQTHSRDSMRSKKLNYDLEQNITQGIKQLKIDKYQYNFDLYSFSSTRSSMKKSDEAQVFSDKSPENHNQSLQNNQFKSKEEQIYSQFNNFPNQAYQNCQKSKENAEDCLKSNFYVKESYAQYINDRLKLKNIKCEKPEKQNNIQKLNEFVLISKHLNSNINQLSDKEAINIEDTLSIDKYETKQNDLINKQQKTKEQSEQQQVLFHYEEFPSYHSILKKLKNNKIHELLPSQNNLSSEKIHEIAKLFLKMNSQKNIEKHLPLNSNYEISQNDEQNNINYIKNRKSKYSLPHSQQNQRFISQKKFNFSDYNKQMAYSQLNSSSEKCEKTPPQLQTFPLFKRSKTQIGNINLQRHNQQIKEKERKLKEEKEECNMNKFIKQMESSSIQFHVAEALQQSNLKIKLDKFQKINSEIQLNQNFRVQGFKGFSKVKQNIQQEAKLKNLQKQNISQTIYDQSNNYSCSQIINNKEINNNYFNSQKLNPVHNKSSISIFSTNQNYQNQSPSSHEFQFSKTHSGFSHFFQPQNNKQKFPTHYLTNYSPPTEKTQQTQQNKETLFFDYVNIK